MISIITPCSRQANLPKLYESIDFNRIDQWVIVYDTSNKTYKKLYEGHPKIKEVECQGGISGNPQRNYGLTLVDDGFIYFLDDDNIIHPNFWKILDGLEHTKFYTFDQLRNKNGQILYGNNVRVGSIDTAMFIVHKSHIGDIQWINNRYDADGYFISEILDKNKSSHAYINSIGCYYNFI